jgi:predicted Mrr-cat superfamily restriction endonuclease
MAYHDAAEEDRVINWYRTNSRIAIGWGAIGDLRQFHGPDEISRRVKQVYRDTGVWPSGHGGPCLWRFYHEMGIGDLVIVNASADEQRRRRMVMKIKGPYEFVTAPAVEDYPHQRVAEYVERDPNELWHGKALGENIRWALVRCR